jgi:hypothetical protein
VLVVDSVLPPGNERHGGKWLDLLMLALFFGRERTEEEWRALLTGAGFRIDAVGERLIEASCP